MDTSRLEALEHALWDVVDEYKAGSIRSPAEAKRQISGLLGILKDTEQVYGYAEILRRFLFGFTVKLRVSSLFSLEKLLKTTEHARFTSGAKSVGVRWVAAKTEGVPNVVYVMLRVRRYRQLLSYIKILGDGCDVSTGSYGYTL